MCRNARRRRHPHISGQRRKAPTSHIYRMNAANLWCCFFAFMCIYINNIRYVQILEQCGLSGIVLMLCTPHKRSVVSVVVDWRRKKRPFTHVLASPNSWLSMWVCEPCRLIVLVCSLSHHFARSYDSLLLYIPFFSFNDKYVSAWVTVYFLSLVRFAIHRLYLFFSYVYFYRMHIKAIHYTHRHIFSRWLAAERSFFFLHSLLHTRARFLKWRVNDFYGWQFFLFTLTRRMHFQPKRIFHVFFFNIANISTK